MRWDIDVPIFRNSIVLRQLGVAIGIPFGLLALWMLALALTGDRGARYGLILLGATALGTYALLWVLYRGTYRATFHLDEKRAHEQMQTDQREKSRWINRLTLILGFLSRNPTAMGAGLLAASAAERTIRWKDVRRIRVHQGHRTILLVGPPGHRIALFCTDQNFEMVRLYVEQRTKEK